MKDQLTLSLLYSFAIIEAIRKLGDHCLLGDAFRAVQETHDVTIDGASPMNIWPHFQDANGTGLRVHMAYPKNLEGFSWGIPVVSQIEAIPNLVDYFTVVCA